MRNPPPSPPRGRAARVGLFALALCVGHAAAAQRTIHVSASNPNCPGSGTPNDPFCTIQDGIDAAAAGDIVLVADGVYRGSGNKWLTFGGPLGAFTLLSESGPADCIIDLEGTGTGFVFVADEPPGLVIRGFTVTNGRSGEGAVFLHHDASPTLVDCVFTGNASFRSGGAVISDASGGFPLFLGCTFAGNSAASGGAVFLGSASGVTSFANCVFTGNAATLDGGAATVAGPGGASFLNCTLADNTAAGGGGLFSAALTGVTVTNTIAWDNAGGQIAGPATVTFSNVQGGHAGAGNIDADPRFVDAAGGDYHLLATSACIGRGTGAVPLPPTDFEGDPRMAFGSVDIGADEHFQHLYHVGRAAPGSSIEVRFLGRAGEPAFWLLSTGVASPVSIPGLNGSLQLEPASLVGVRLGALPAEGLVKLPVSIPAGFPMVSIPTQALIGTQLTNLDPVAVR